MRRSVEFDLETRTPNAVRFASKRGQKAHAEWIKRQRKAVREVLTKHFTPPPTFYRLQDGRAPNSIRVHFTRIAAGTLDPEENLPMAFKHVKDEVAEWCGFKNDRDPIFKWVVPYGQERAAPHVQRVRIVIEDLEPGERPPVVLAETTSEGRAAKSRIKRQVKEAKMHKDGVKREGRVLTYQPEAGARAASSAARSKAEEAFARLQEKTGYGLDAGRLARPTALNLRDAAEGVLARAAGGRTGGARSVGMGARAGHGEQVGTEGGQKGSNGSHVRSVARDPGEERPARDLAPCTTCLAEIGQPCRDGVPGPRIALVYGVHPARARAAGLQGAQIASRPKAPTNGSRRIVPPAQAPLPLPPAYLAFPWDQPLNGSIAYRVRRAKAPDGSTPLDGEHAPPTAVYIVPAEHRARFGDQVTLTRRRTTLPKLGDVWLYE